MLVYNLVCICDPISFSIYRACANIKVKGHKVTRIEHNVHQGKVCKIQYFNLCPIINTSVLCALEMLVKETARILLVTFRTTLQIIAYPLNCFRCLYEITVKHIYPEANSTENIFMDNKMQ